MWRSLKLRQRLFGPSAEDQRRSLCQALDKIRAADPEAIPAIMYAFAVSAGGTWGETALPTRVVHDPDDPNVISVDFSRVPEEILDEWFDVIDIYIGKPLPVLEIIFAALAQPKYRSMLIEDQREVFSQDCDRFGATKANLLYVADTIRALGPLFERVTKMGAVVELARRLFRLVLPG